MNLWFVSTALVMTYVIVSSAEVWSVLDLPAEHVPFYLYSHPDVRQRCMQDPACPYQAFAGEEKCWGYEKGCTDAKKKLSQPFCTGDLAHGWARSREEQVQKFWSTADFGYVKERLDEMTVLCKARNPGDSSLACAKYTRYCRAENIVLDFKTADLLSGYNQYREDLFKAGQIGGRCEFDQAKLQAEGQHKSPLQSWYAELEHYTALDFTSFEDAGCDVILDKPTILIKLDAGVNMFHHFCDYVNLYAAQHVNGSWSRDVYIIMWNTSPMKYGDFFHDTWQAFSKHPIIHLNKYDGRKLCIRDAVFSLLARMRYGLYYNMPLIPNCYRSSLMQAFSQHILHRLNVTQEWSLESKIRVTMLSRGSKYRNIMNQDELVAALKAVSGFEVNVVKYDSKYPFLQQLQMTYNSDIFIGMHGAGLTHLLFQPNWAVVFEIYNCDDTHCYKDLARLRGIRYITWENEKKLIQEDEGHHPTLGAHKKFTNYAFDVAEFMRLVMDAAEYVRNHEDYKAAMQLRHPLSVSLLKEEL